MKWLDKRREKKRRDRWIVLEEQMRQHLRGIHSRGIAKWCFTCGWFILRKEPPRNRVCRCPNHLLKFQGNECLGWRLDPEYQTRKASVIA